MVVFTEQDITTKGRENDYILGHACGNRVAVITTKNINLRDISITAIHEFMHTLGFDHCEEFVCLMNTNVYDEDGEDGCEIEVCPVDLLKLKSELKFDIKTRFENLKRTYKELNWDRDYKLCDNLIEGLSQNSGNLIKKKIKLK